MSNWETDEECLEFVQAFRERGLNGVDLLHAEVLLLMPPLSKPKSAKKVPTNPWMTDRSLALNIASFHPAAPPFLQEFREVYRPFLDDKMKVALEKGDAGFWEAVAFFTRRSALAFSSPNSVPHLAVYAIRAKADLKLSLGRLPLKGEVIQRTMTMRREDGLSCPAADESSEWRKILKAAELQYLKQARPGSVKAREI